MIDKIIEEIKKANTIAIMAHTGEDPDAVGSCFAMCDMLCMLGKQAVCYLSEKLKRSLSFLEGEYTVYAPQDSDIDFDLCICLDCGDLERLGDRIKIFESSKVTINIDHHYTNTHFADINFVKDDAAATGEILYYLLCEMGELSVYAAKCLYTAIAADTGSFKYSNVTPDTLRIAANLLEKNINHADIARQLFDTEELAVMRLKTEVAGNIKSYFNGRLNIVIAPKALFEKYGIDEDEAGDFVDIPRRVAGVEVAASIKEYEDKVKVSLRSSGRVNVAEIAQLLGGGGHKMAAGASAELSIEDAEKRLVELVEPALCKDGR
ncbi:MAG: bifunctional oligoribonuclease/PAP phosphatase NrnA [Clostridia bacterium]|nr:bifunctional oligoribonuclease/PAP phosphatase NrnA [Clostridia bacterium]